jgi:endonuclease G
VAQQGGWKVLNKIIACLLAGALASVAQAAEDFQGCLRFFAQAQPPRVALRPSTLALAPEKRGDVFFADARLPAAERATLDDYAASGFDRGHMAPAGDMRTAQAMAQSFSLANMMPQAPDHNRGVWAQTVELATRKFAARADGDVYVITGPVFAPSIADSPSIGPGKVHVPAYLFKLVYDQASNRAWAHWQANADATRGSQPISYAELVLRTGVVFLPGVRPLD